jgi:hypothetical protein
MGEDSRYTYKAPSRRYQAEHQLGPNSPGQGMLMQQRAGQRTTWIEITSRMVHESKGSRIVSIAERRESGPGRTRYGL